MNLPRFSIRHPVTVIMIILVIVTVGLMALWKVPTDMFPEITYPVLRSLPGIRAQPRKRWNRSSPTHWKNTWQPFMV